MTEHGSVDLEAAERFVLANARLLDRHRLAYLLHGGPSEPVIAALRAYRNPDGGFGHALEPDVRAPTSEPSATLHAFEVLAEVAALDEPMLRDAADWVASVAEPDGGIPFSLPESAAYPRAPFLGPPAPGGSMFTFALAGWFFEAGLENSWLERAAAWSWASLEDPSDLHAYGVKCAIDFLDRVHDEERAMEALQRLRPHLTADGSVPVTGGKEGEKLTPLTLSERPDARSRALFSAEQIEADLDRLEREQEDDGGWMIDFGVWSEGQLAECRGLFTYLSVRALLLNTRL